MKRLLWLTLAATLTLGATALWHRADAQGWRVLYEKNFGPPLALGNSHEWALTGDNTSSEVIEFWLRADDSSSKDYSSRINQALKVPPGPFTLRLSLAGMRTPSGKALDISSVRFLTLFQSKASPALMIHDFRLIAHDPFPDSTVALDLGAAGSAVFPGFTLLTPSDPRLSGQYRRAIGRPGGDILTDDGIFGIDQLRLKIAPGRWRLSLWIDDVGEWEYLPHDLQRRIEVNGEVFWERQWNADSWFEQVYLAGRENEALLDGDPWQLYRRHRGRAMTRDISVGPAGEVLIHLSGTSATAKYLGALLLEPVQSKSIVEQVERSRAERFAELWRVDMPDSAPYGQAAIWPLRPGTELSPATRPDRRTVKPAAAVAARGSMTFFEAAALGGEALKRQSLKLILVPPHLKNGATLPAAVRVGYWRFRREGNLLVPTSDELRGNTDAVRLDAALPRRLHVQIGVPPSAQPGTYLSELRLQDDGGKPILSLPFEVTVLDISLPPADRPVGVYLRSPPHVDWFEQFANTRDLTLKCDLAVLASAGLTTAAPPLTTPLAGDELELLKDLAAAQAAGLQPPFLAYTPVKKLLETSADTAPEQIARTHRGIAAASLAQPLWSIADEPSNPGPGRPDPLELAVTLRGAVPGIRLAGHLNAPSDQRFLPAFDAVFVNPGFGVDKADLAALRKDNIEPWLYNMPDPRLAAGFYLWRVDAAGYLQWHGRMPTADPYDPTDGREGDFQMLYPSKAPCAAIPDVSATLFRISEGITDLRWMRWLETKARSDPDASKMLRQLQQEIPAEWRVAVNAGSSAPELWRNKIVALARAKAASTRPRPNTESVAICSADCETPAAPR